jgi:hypothetical protein
MRGLQGKDDFEVVFQVGGHLFHVLVCPVVVWMRKKLDKSTIRDVKRQGVAAASP